MAWFSFIFCLFVCERNDICIIYHLKAGEIKAALFLMEWQSHLERKNETHLFGADRTLSLEALGEVRGLGLGPWPPSHACPLGEVAWGCREKPGNCLCG